MTKQESIIIKGVVILFMIYGHLFLYPEWSGVMYDSIFQIKNISLECLLTRATGPVGFYLLLGGYGMYYIYQNKGNRNQLPRIRNLYVNFWIVLFFYVLLGHIVKPDVYPGSIKTLIYNATGYITSYNAEWWFLLPYSLVILSSYWVFKFVDRINPLLAICGCFVGLFATSFIISRFGLQYLYTYHLRYNLFLYFHLLWEFVIGAMLLKMDFFRKAKLKIQRYLSKNIYVVCALILLVALRCLFDTSAVQIFYIIAFIALFLSISRWAFVDKCLMILGNNSMNMWFIHTIFCYYLCKDFIYGFRYPIIIFIVTTLLSLACAIIVGKLSRFVLSKKDKN